MRAAKPVIGGMVVCVLLIALYLMWKVTPLSDYAAPERLTEHLEGVRGSVWAAPVIMAIFIIGGLLFFPVTVMIMATAASFGPSYGFPLVLAGTLASAGVGYGIGYGLGEKKLQSLMQGKIALVREKINGSGIAGICALRMVPVAPFSLVNYILGLSGVPFSSYMAGTLLGMSPGMAVMVLTGDSLARLWRNPDRENILYAATGLVAWLAVIALSHYLAHYFARRKRT